VPIVSKRCLSVWILFLQTNFIGFIFKISFVSGTGSSQMVSISNSSADKKQSNISCDYPIGRIYLSPFHLPAFHHFQTKRVTDE